MKIQGFDGAGSVDIGDGHSERYREGERLTIILEPTTLDVPARGLSRIQGGDGAHSDDEDNEEDEDGLTIMWGGGEDLDSLCGCECIPEALANALHAAWWCVGEIAEALLGHFVC